MFWHMVQYGGYLIAAALVGLAVGWLIWARSAQRTQDRFEARAKEMRAELMERRQETAAQQEELVRLRRVAEAAAVAPAAAKAAPVVEAAAPVVEEVAPVVEDVAPVETPAASEADALVEAPTPTVDADSSDAATTPDTTISSLVGATDAANTAAPSKPDDLTVIEGIGPKFGAALVTAGITTFAGLSEASEETLTEAIKAAGLNFAPSLPTWARQAAFLAKGDTAGFKEYTDRLVAGREAD